MYTVRQLVELHNANEIEGSHVLLLENSTPQIVQNGLNRCVSKTRRFFQCSSVLPSFKKKRKEHYNDVIMGAIASQITSPTIVYSFVYSDADQRKHQSSASLAFVRGIHRGPVNSPHKWPVTRKMFPFDDVIMATPKITKQMRANKFGGS